MTNASSNTTADIKAPAKRKRKSKKKKTTSHAKKAAHVSDDAKPVEQQGTNASVKKGTKASKTSSKKHKHNNKDTDASIDKESVDKGTVPSDDAVVSDDIKTTTTADVVDNNTSSLKKKNANKRRAATLAGPTMWASHQTYQFASENLSTTIKFVKQKLTELMRNVYGETDEEVIRDNIAMMLGEKAFKLRSKKDPSMPKRPLTGYQLWCRNFNKTASNKPVDLIELSRLQSKKWRAISEVDKIPFLEEAKQAKADYKIALSDYKNKKVIITPVVARNK